MEPSLERADLVLAQVLDEGDRNLREGATRALKAIKPWHPAAQRALEDAEVVEELLQQRDAEGETQ
jgi:hypothetical protein